MKRVKIMLLSLAIIAVVGAALAFKVKDGSTKLCTAGFVSGCNLACPNLVQSTITSDPLATQFCYGTPTTTTTIIGGEEQPAPISTCTTYTGLDINRPNNVGCTAAARLKQD